MLHSFDEALSSLNFVRTQNFGLPAASHCTMKLLPDYLSYSATMPQFSAIFPSHVHSLLEASLNLYSAVLFWCYTVVKILTLFTISQPLSPVRISIISDHAYSRFVAIGLINAFLLNSIDLGLHFCDDGLTVPSLFFGCTLRFFYLLGFRTRFFQLVSELIVQFLIVFIVFSQLLNFIGQILDTCVIDCPQFSFHYLKFFHLLLVFSTFY